MRTTVEQVKGPNLLGNEEKRQNEQVEGPNLLGNEEKQQNEQVEGPNLLGNEEKRQNKQVEGPNLLGNEEKRKRIDEQTRFEKNVAGYCGRALEYEKALPRKGKVFQMKCLPRSNEEPKQPRKRRKLARKRIGRPQANENSEKKSDDE